MDGLLLDHPFLDFHDERDVMLEAAELAFNKALLRYEMLDRLQNLQIREAELQCYAESADTDTYLSYMEAATEQVSGKKQSALLKLWERVKQLFQTLIAKFFGKNKGKDLPKDEKFAVPKPFAAFIKKAKVLVAGAKSAIMNTKKKLSENPKWKALVIAIAAVTAFGVLTIRHINKMKRVEKMGDHFHNESMAMDVANSVLDEANKRARSKGIDEDRGGLTYYMKNKDITYISGIELNEGYSSLSDFFKMCVNHSDDVMKHYSKQFGDPTVELHYGTLDDYQADRAKEMENIAKGLKPILDKIQFVRQDFDIRDDKPFDTARERVNRGEGQKF